jgi:hypothetical protein
MRAIIARMIDQGKRLIIGGKEKPATLIAGFSAGD